VRGSSDQLRVASARQLSSVGLALLADAKALREEVRLIPTDTQNHITAETDCQVLVSLWKNRGIHRSEIATILNEVEELVASFMSFKLVRTRRSMNHAAHFCAQHSLVSFHNFVWQSPPSFLQNCLQFDCNSSP
jgi:hypothetical protein